jgi:alanine dehydrogenase
MAVDQARDLIESGATCMTYETVTSPSGGLPLRAGRMSIQAGAYFLEKTHGGFGMLLGGVPGVDPAKLVVRGGGVVGTHAIHIALGMGADVWGIDRDVDVLRQLWRQFGRPLNTVYSTRDAIEKHVLEADLVIGGVLIPGAAAPKLVGRDLVRRMKPGSVVVDVAIDQGGCFETSQPTTHDQRPTSSITSSTTVSPTCRAACRAPRPSPSTMRRFHSCWRSLIRVTSARFRTIRT